MLKVFGQGGDIYSVSQGIGLGIREHADVMLSWGYSRKTYIHVLVPAGQSLIVKAVIPEGLKHHAEARVLLSANANVEFKIYKGVTPANIPAVVSVMPIVNQKGPSLITNTAGTTYEYCGLVTTNPIVSGGLIDDYPLYTNVAQGNVRSAPTSISGVTGRYYDPSTYAVVIKNTGSEASYIYYEYRWHEFE